MAEILTKNGQNSCFLKTLWPKSQNVLTMIISMFIGVSNCFRRQYIFCRKHAVLLKKQVFTLQQQFLL